MSFHSNLHLCRSVEAVKLLVGSLTVNGYIFLQTGYRPEWIDVGQARIGSQVYGFSDVIQEYMLEYEELFDESQSPKNRHTIGEPTHTGYAYLARCSDAITLQLQVVDSKITDIGWVGQGCTICLASASRMSGALRGLTIHESLAQEDIFKELMTPAVALKELLFNELLEPLRIFIPINVNPMKVECVMVPWLAFRKALENGDKITTNV